MPKHSQAFFVSIPPHDNRTKPMGHAPILTGDHTSSPLGQQLRFGRLVTAMSQFIPLNVRTYFGMHTVNSLYEQHFIPPHHPVWLTGPKTTQLELIALDDPLLETPEDQPQNSDTQPKCGMLVKPYHLESSLVAHAGWIPSMFPITELTILPSVFHPERRPGLQGLEWAETLKMLVLNGTSICDADLAIIKTIPNLKHLEIASCPMLRTIQGLRNAPNLKVLDASNNDFAQDDGHVLGSLPLLELLNISGSTGFSNLNELQNTKNLHYADLSRTNVEGNTLMVLGKLPLVDNVNFSHCINDFNLLITFAPDQKQLAFKRLDLSNINVNDSIFDWIAKMPALETLSFANATTLLCKSLHDLSAAQNLMQLDFSGTVISSLQEVGLLPLLEFLNINDCAKLETLDGLQHASKLRKLTAINTQLKSTESICELNDLTYVDFSRSTSIQIMRLPRRIKIMHLSNFPMLPEPAITALKCYEHLVDLDLDRLGLFPPSFLCDLQSVKNHTLRRLSIRESSITQEEFNKIFEILFYTPLKNDGLQDIMVSGSSNIKKLPPLRQPCSPYLMLECLSLRELEVGDDDLLLIATLFPNLKALNISGCKKITDFTPIAKLLHLESLNLSNTNITDEHLENIISGLEYSCCLQILDLRQCSELSCNSASCPKKVMDKFNILKKKCLIIFNNGALEPSIISLSFHDSFDVKFTIATYSIFKPHQVSAPEDLNSNGLTPPQPPTT